MRRLTRIFLGCLATGAVVFGAWTAARTLDSKDPGTSADGAPGDAEPAQAVPPPPLAWGRADPRAPLASRTPSGASASPAPDGFLARGRVLDAEGRPVVGAVVRPSGAAASGVAATTDADGRFALASTVPVPERVVVSTAGYEDAVLTLASMGSDVEVVLVRVWTISGTVRDAETGEPISAIPVSATPTTSPESVDPRIAAWESDGTFRVTVPRAGTYVLDVGGRDLRGGGAAANEWVPTRVEGVAAGRTDVRVAIQRGRSIEGEILDDVGERVTRRLTVDAVRRTAAGDPDYTMRKMVFVEGGLLRVPGLPPGRFDLWIQPDADVADAVGALVSSTVVRNVESGTRGLLVRLQRGFVLSGRLEDGAGGPVLGPGSLNAFPEGETARSHPIVGEVVGDGSFRIGPLEDGLRYDLVATGFAGRRPGLLPGVGPRDPGVVVVLVGAKGVGGRVEGEDGKPVPSGVPVGIVGEALDPRAPGVRVFGYTAADGTFLVHVLADVAFTVEAGGGRSGYVGSVVSGVKAGTTDLVLRVRVGVDLAGFLVDEHGEPVATTSLVADDGGRLAAMRPYDQVGPDGKFLLRGLRAGPVRLSLRLGATFVDVGTAQAPAEGLRIVVPAR